MTCIPVPKHKSDIAFRQYHQKKPYVKEFCKAVGGGNYKHDVSRMLLFPANKQKKLYICCGQKKGLAMSNGMSAISLAAMQTDCNLKRWQLLCVAKHVGAATNLRMSVKSKELKKFED